jgi:peptide deformylase
MILPIVAYGNPVLKKKAQEIDPLADEVQELIDDMWETMYNANGVGLAAPQIGKSWRIFIIDPSPFAADDSLSEVEKKELESLKQTFINPEILEQVGDEWNFEEGCLSIPDVREDVFRKPEILLAYQDRQGNEKEERFSGVAARVIQHEHDHIEGVLFTDRISALKKRLIKSKLNAISKGKIEVDYRMKFPRYKK